MSPASFRFVLRLLLALAAGAICLRVEAALPPWRIELLYGESEIYPSALLSVTDDALFPPRFPDDWQLGDPKGLVCALLSAPRDDCPVTVTVGANALFEESSVTVRLPRRGRPYRVAPYLILKHAELIALKHSIAGEQIKVTLTIDGESTTQFRSVRVHSVNDCLTSVYLGGRTYETGYFLAAYANEYYPPLLNRIVRHALDRGYVRSFDGYASGQPTDVTRQVEAIYRTLKDFGFEYSSLFRSSIASKRTGTQSVRLPGDSMASRQTNCVDGTALFAAILTRLNLRAVMFFIPEDHAFLGVYRTAAGDESAGFDVVETTLVGLRPFDEALQQGRKRLERARRELREVRLSDQKAESLISWDPRAQIVDGFYNIEIRAARARGILPLPEVHEDGN